MFDWITDLYEWITTLPARFLDAVLSPAADLIDGLSPLEASPASMFSSLGVDILQLATLFGIPQGMAIIGTAYAVRFLIQLIPFIRLGS